MVFKNARASATASAIASLVTEPGHSAAIASQDSPLATSLKTCRTMTREPMKVGLP